MNKMTNANKVYTVDTRRQRSIGDIIAILHPKQHLEYMFAPLMVLVERYTFSRN